jgi:hypothetical protein
VRLQYLCKRFGSKNSLGLSVWEQRKQVVEAMGKYEGVLLGEGRVKHGWGWRSTIVFQRAVSFP